MKNSVLSQAMNSLRTNGMTDVYSIIALASLCDFAFKHRMIAQLMPNSFSEDLKYFYKNFEEFKVLKDSLQDFEIFSSNENDLFYRELKKQSLKNEDDPRENMSVIELLNSKSYREQDNYLLAENVLSPVIADWISGGKTGLKIYCPFNSMLNVESSLPRDNQIISPCTSEKLKLARTLHLICNGMKVPELPVMQFEEIKGNQEFFDAGFTFPPLDKDMQEQIIENLVYSITGRFCVIVSLGFTFRLGNTAKIRNEVLDTRRLQAVAELPTGFLPNSGISCAALFFAPKTDFQDSVMFINLSGGEFRDRERSSRMFTVLNNPAVEILKSGLAGTEYELCKKVSYSEIESGGQVITPSRYVLSAEVQSSQEQILKGSTRLSEIVDFVRVQVGRKENEGELYYEVTAGDINPAGLVEQPERAIHLSKDNPALKSQLRQNDLIFAIKGSVGKVGLIIGTPCNWVVNQSFVILRLKNKDWPVEFVFRQLKSNAMKNYIQSKTTGSVIPSLTMAELRELPLIAPTPHLVEKQRFRHERQIKLVKQIRELQKELAEFNDF
ncbi:MAG: N-6 DNA methylase [Succinivibrionaceae bacterium]|nr:N-6 DNA methylase [Succinivibrionaceae bacterium]